MSPEWSGGSLPALFFDDECPLCTRSAWFIDRHDRERRLRFVALESDEGRALRTSFPALAKVDSLIWLGAEGAERTPTALHYSAAVLRIGRYLGGWWALLARLAWLVPRPLRDATYRIVARHRK